MNDKLSKTMTLTEIERAIIVMNLIGVILEEYKSEESTKAIKTLKEKCKRFSRRQSGTEERIVRNKIGQKVPAVLIVDAKRHKRYINASMIGDKIWRETIEHFAKQKLKIDAVALIEAVYLMNENIILKHTTIKRDDIDAYRFENDMVDEETYRNGTAIGGHIMGLMMREAGVHVNGKLRAMRLKIEDEKGRAA